MNLKQIFFPKNEGETRETAGARTCAAGHAMDPSWGEVCPYCEAIKRGGDKSSDKGSRVADVQPTSAADPRRTHVGEPVPPGRRETKVDSSGTSAVARAPTSPDTRRITGVLATFSWQAAGELFPVREGKNTIGRRACEVSIGTDPEISEEHALILCRQGKYEFLDLNSSNGSFVNGNMVSTQGMELPNNARIKTGATVFQFLKIEGRAPTGATPPAYEPEPVRNPDRSEGDNLTSIS